jgi:hypothetical protein
MADKQPGNGKDGYYLASPGSVAWLDIYEAMARALAKQGVVDDEIVQRADESTLSLMAKALDCPPAAVAIQLGGL